MSFVLRDKQSTGLRPPNLHPHFRQLAVAGCTSYRLDRRAEKRVHLRMVRLESDRLPMICDVA